MFKKLFSTSLAFLMIIGIGIITSNAALKSYSSSISTSPGAKGSLNYQVSFSANTIADKIYYDVQSIATVYKDGQMHTSRMEKCRTESSCYVSDSTTGLKSQSANWLVFASHRTYSIDPDGVKEVDYATSSDTASWIGGAEPESTNISFDSQLNAFHDAVLKDYISSFDLKLDNYYNMEMNKLVPFLNENKSLAKHYADIIHGSNVGDTLPDFFINDSYDHAIVLIKSFTGTNSKYEFKLNNNDWEMVTKESKEGKVINVEQYIK